MTGYCAAAVRSALLRHEPLRLTCFAAVCFGLLGVSRAPAADLVPVESLGLRVARGFSVTLFADANMANDIYAMTLDPRGRVVVTSKGYIRTLDDEDYDGVADAATDFAPTPTGGMGLCFDGPDLYFVGDGALWRYRDANGDGISDGAPDKLVSLAFSEHGGHAVRKGPDGWFYVIGGNDARFDQIQPVLASSPVRAPEAGALLRVAPGGRAPEIIAHGFRNAYDFDFNPLGDLFTYDSDGERDFFLPWYTPTRLYQIAYGGHHGWRLAGYLRSWSRPDYYADTVSILARLGRGSPTGVACYRHLQFPPYYRGGLFALDWTFGRAYFLPLQPTASGYDTAPEIFLEPIGQHGFAPSDVCVATDGALLISIGGRRTRGGVYRIQYVAGPTLALSATNWLQWFGTTPDAVLAAPQPLDAWSRAHWEPIARRIGPDPFLRWVEDNRVNIESRVRAIEVFTELFGGLPSETAATAARATSPQVRARVAWSLGRAPNADTLPILLGLAQDAAPAVRRSALDALVEQSASVSAQAVQQAVTANFSHPDKSVRQSAARLATYLPENTWTALWPGLFKADPQTRLTAVLAHLWRNPPSSANLPAVQALLEVLAQSKAAEHRLQAVRLTMLALGDYCLNAPSAELYTGYEPAFAFQGNDALLARLRQAAASLFPSGDVTVDFEVARLLAMLEADDPALTVKLLAYVADQTSPTTDFHYLTVLSRLKARWPTNTAPRIAHALLSLDRKLGGLENRTKQNWSARLAELAQGLVRRDPRLPEALLRHADFPRPAHLGLVEVLGAERYPAAARRFLVAVQHDPRFPWSGPLVELLAALPSEEVFPLFRKQWSNLALRDALLLTLAQKPELTDRDKFVVGLGSSQSKVMRAAMSALLKLPPDPSDQAILGVLRALRRLLNEPKEQVARAQLMALLNHQAGQRFKIEERAIDPASLRNAYQPVFDWFMRSHPALVRSFEAGDDPDPTAWSALLKSVTWEKGNAARGQALFEQRGCQACHATSTPLGPDLGGIALRLSPLDLFYAIIYPSRDVAASYRMTTFQTRAGTYTGLVVFESADGVILQTSASTTVRLAETDIVSRQPSDLSLMPTGLLAGLRSPELADLYAYLQTLPMPAR
jgi:putative membrane-bound dehydrogenase-like protein